VVELDLLQRLEQPLQEPDRVLVAVLRGEAVARVASLVGDVKVADMSEADDGGLPRAGMSRGPPVSADAIGAVERLSKPL
jgi:hypothetical protein